MEKTIIEQLSKFQEAYNRSWLELQNAISKLAPKEDKPEWEITSYKAAGASYIYNKQNNGRFICIGTNTTVDEEDFDPSATIYSVKRLSDGEVFSVGDETVIGIISSFEIKNYPVDSCRNSIMWVILNRASESTKCNFILLDKVEKCLFTTEDGKEIFDYRTITWYVKLLDWQISHQALENYKIINSRKDIKIFSTQQAAEEFILMNKPCLSIQDVLPTLTYSERGISPGNTFEKLQELVKSRLSQ